MSIEHKKKVATGWASHGLGLEDLLLSGIKDVNIASLYLNVSALEALKALDSRFYFLEEKEVE